MIMRVLACLWLLCWMPQIWAQVSPTQNAQTWATQAARWIFNDERLPQALALNLRARRAYQEDSDVLGIAHTYINEAAALNQQNDFEAAARVLNRIEVKSLPQRGRLHGRLLLVWAWTHWAQGQYETAIAEADSAQVWLLDKEDRTGAPYAALISAYATYYQNKNAYNDIDQRLRRVVTLAEGQLPETHLVYRYWYQLRGSVLLHQGHLGDAIKHNLIGLELERAALIDSPNTRDSVRLAQYYNRLGRLYAERGNVEQSSGYYEQALKTYRSLRQVGQQLKLCVRLSQLQQQQGNYLKAKSYSTQLPDLLKQYTASPAEQRREKSFAHLAQAYYYQQTHRYQDLLDYYKSTLPIIERADLAPHKAYQNIATAHGALGHHALAEKAYEHSLAYVKQHYGDHNARIGALYHALALLADYQQQPARTRLFLDSALHQLAPLQETQQGFSADLYLDKKRAAQLYHRRAKLFLSEQRYAEATVDLERAIDLQHYIRQHYIGDASKLLSARQLRPLYEDAALSAWRQYQANPSFDLKQRLFGYTERSKGTALHENLLKFRNQYSHEGKGIPSALLEEEEGLLVQLGQYKEQQLAAKRAQSKDLVEYYLQKIFEVQEKLQALEERLKTEYPHYQSWQQLPDATLTLQQVQQTLKPQQVLLEYLLTDSLCLVWYLTHNDVQVTEVASYRPKKFERQLSTLRQGLSDVYETERDSTLKRRWTQIATEFYQTYVQHPLLDDKTELVVVPDGPLYYIPFEVLLTEPVAEDVPYAKLPYFLHRSSVHYHYSADLLLYTMQHASLPSGKLLGFAASYGSQNDYGELPIALQQVRSFEEVQTHNYSLPIPGTVEELKRLEEHYLGLYHQYQNANERALKEQFDDPQYGVVHLAMHGIVNYKDPAYSSLVFTENLDSLEDNLLYAYEVQHLHGQAVNLVVLSACKTGYGRYAKGEGIISLGRSFIQAGAPSVVMTLWELNDETTTHIMARFYEGLANGLTKNEALRQAKINYLEEHQGMAAHPFFWASSICIGNPAAIPVERRHQPWMTALLLGVLAIGTVITWKRLLC